MTIQKVKILIIAVVFVFRLSNCTNDEANNLIDSSVK